MRGEVVSTGSPQGQGEGAEPGGKKFWEEAGAWRQEGPGWREEGGRKPGTHRPWHLFEKDF